MDAQSVFPDQILERALPDEPFAVAYEATPPSLRASFKTAIERICLYYGGAAPQVSGVAAREFPGFQTSIAHRPGDWALIVLSPGFSSPSPILAAVLPAMLAGVSDIAVLRVDAHGAPWPDPVLTALELAGQELLLDCSAQETFALACEMGAKGAGAVLALGERVVDWAPLSDDIPVKSLGRGMRIGVLEEQGGAPCDFDLLRFSCPDAMIEVWGDVEDVPEGVALKKGDAGEFWETPYPVRWISGQTRSCAAAKNASGLILGPGNESVWLWPGLAPTFFQQTSAAFFPA